MYRLLNIQHRYSIGILLFLIPLISYSQADTINYQALFNSINNCEGLTEQIQKLVPQYVQKDPVKAKQLIDIWEKTCDHTEPSLRMYILLDIKAGTFNENTYSEYYKDMAKQFIDRTVDTKDKDYQAIYDSSRSFYNYIPLRGEYDKTAQSLALSLRDAQTVNSSAYLLCVLFSGDVETFNKLIVKDDYKNTALFKSFFPEEIPEISDIVHLGVGAGIWMPFGTLAHSFKINPTIGINVRVNVNKWSYGLELHFRIPNNKNPFEIVALDTVYKVKQSFSLNAGLTLARLIEVNKKFTMETIVGLGVDNIQTDKEKPNTFNNDDEKQYYNITTLNLNAGIGFWYKLQGRQELGIQFRYMYSPYKWDGNLDTSIGTNALLVSVYYGF
ncbi:MAG TPA: hypothetical protein VK590_12735 [Saprospiraceae bacterium]|nr:hypothetical protein [Saprospiraceae bacterium]